MNSSVNYFHMKICIYTSLLCVQLLQEVVDEVGDSYPDPPTCYITLYAEENVAKRLLYDVSITGAQTKNLSFSIECDLPDPSCKLL